MLITIEMNFFGQVLIILINRDVLGLLYISIVSVSKSHGPAFFTAVFLTVSPAKSDQVSPVSLQFLCLSASLKHVDDSKQVSDAQQVFLSRIVFVCLITCPKIANLYQKFTYADTA